MQKENIGTAHRRTYFNREKVYIITGGLGGLGNLVWIHEVEHCEWKEWCDQFS